MNAERTFFSTSQKGKQRRRERWNNSLNVYTSDIQARHSAFRALAVNQTVPLKVDIFSWAPWKISSTVLRIKSEEMGKTQVIYLGQKALHLGALMPTWIKFLKFLNPPLPGKPCPPQGQGLITSLGHQEVRPETNVSYKHQSCTWHWISYQSWNADSRLW